MSLAGVSEETINGYIARHSESGNDLTAVDTIIRDDIGEVMTERDDVNSLPVICMGFYGGWNKDPAELAEQIQNMLSTYSQQEDYVVLGMYPDPSYYDNRDAYDEAMYNAFGDHYLPLNYGYLDQPGFYEAGHRQIAQALFDKLNALGYLDKYNSSAPAETVDEAAADDAAEDTGAAEDAGATDAAAEETVAEDTTDAG